MTPELKPCPFCGGDATTLVGKYDHGGTFYEAGCDSVGCWCLPSAKTLSMEHAVAEWNRRADMPPTLAQALALPEIAALVEAAQNLHDYGTVLGKQKYHRAMSDALAKVKA